jgi:hypothetical protein
VERLIEFDDIFLLLVLTILTKSVQLQVTKEKKKIIGRNCLIPEPLG